MKPRWDSISASLAEQVAMNARDKAARQAGIDRDILERLPADIIREKRGADLGEIRNRARQLRVTLTDPREHFGLDPA